MANYYPEAEKASAIAMQQKRLEIIQHNASKQAELDATNAVLGLAQASNKRTSEEAVKELERVYAEQTRDAKVDIAAGQAKVAMSEGVTAGASKGRAMMSYALQSSKDLGSQKQKIETVINKTYIAAENENNALENRKIDALNRFRSGVVSGQLAALQIQAAGQQAYNTTREMEDRLNYSVEQRQGVEQYIQDITQRTEILQGQNRIQGTKQLPDNAINNKNAFMTEKDMLQAEQLKKFMEAGKSGRLSTSEDYAAFEQHKSAGYFNNPDSYISNLLLIQK